MGAIAMYILVPFLNPYLYEGGAKHTVTDVELRNVLISRASPFIPRHLTPYVHAGDGRRAAQRRGRRRGDHVIHQPARQDRDQQGTSLHLAPSPAISLCACRYTNRLAKIEINKAGGGKGSLLEAIVSVANSEFGSLEDGEASACI